MHENEMENYLIDLNYLHFHFLLFNTREIAEECGVTGMGTHQNWNQKHGITAVSNFFLQN